MKRFGCLLLALLFMLCMVACGEQTPVSNDREQQQGAESSMQDNLPNTTERINAPDIDAANLDEYLSNIWDEYKYSVSDPVLDDDQAIYTVEVSHDGRFVNMTGTYEMVLTQGKNDEWDVDVDSCRWINTTCSLNDDELYSEEYYWAAYPLTPAKSDPVCFVLTDISGDGCTVEWWAPDCENTKLNGAFDGTLSTSVYATETEGLGMPRWIFSDIEIDSVKNSSNPICFTLQLTPDDFMIVPSNDSAKYVGAHEINLSRIVNEQHYSDMVIDALHNDAHRDMIDLGAEKLWHEPELVWRTLAAVDSSVWIDSIGYAGSLYLTGDGTRNSSLYVLYGVEISIDCPGTYCPKYGVMYYAVEFTNVTAGDGVLTYDEVDVEPFNDSNTAPLRWIEGGYTDLYMYGSPSLADALDYYETTFGKVYSLEYIEPTETDTEYLEYLEHIYTGKVGIALDDSLNVVSVTEGGAAEAAGVQVDDILVAIYECPVGNMKKSTIAEMLQGRAETEIELTFLREGIEHTFTIVRKAAE